MSEYSPGTFIWCADYANGTLTITVDQRHVDLYALFIAKCTGSNQVLDNELAIDKFHLYNNSFNSGEFEIEGTTYQVVSGLFVGEQFSSLVDSDNFYSFPPQTAFEMQEYEIPIDGVYLQEVLSNNECFLFISTGPSFDGLHVLTHLNEDIPDGYGFLTTSERIGWETEGVTLYNGRYEESGPCMHKLPSQSNLSTTSSEPMTAALILFFAMVIILGIFLCKRHRKLGKQDSQS